NAGLDPDNLAQSDPSRMNFGTDAKKPWKDIWGCGQGISAIKKVVPTAELVQRLVREYEEARQRYTLSARAALSIGCAAWQGMIRCARGDPGRASVQRLDHVFHGFPGITEHHHGLVHVEQFVVQPGIARCHRALVHNDAAGAMDLQDGHASDG